MVRVRETPRGMHSGGARESRLAYAVDLLVQLRRDVESTEPELHRRDRALMPPGSSSMDRASLVMRWLDQLRDAGYWFPGGTVAVVFRLQLLGLFLAGLGVGWGVSSVLFDYDGRRPVNVVHILAVLVGFQVFLLLLLSIASLPGRWSRYVPGLGLLQEILSWLSPGQITRWLARRLPEPVRSVIPTSAGQGMDRWPKRILKWGAVMSAQTFGVGFNLGALTAALYLVTFSDLAFSWSTTLTPDVDRGHRITNLISRPWRAWWSEAVPSRELLESTLYYRQSGAPRGMDPFKWGGWWPFLVASVVAYGLLPRSILLVVAVWRFRSAVNGALAGSAGVDRVVDRLTSEMVSTRATDPEGAAGVVAASEVSVEPSLAGGRYWVINWSGVELDISQVREQLARRPGCELVEMLAAGGAEELEADAMIVKQITLQPPDLGVIVMVKAWEPPMLEFTDFLAELRRGAGPGRRLAVILLGLKSDGGMGAPRAGDVTMWQRRLGMLEDPGLTLIPWEEARD